MNVEDAVAGALELGIYELLRQRLCKAIPVAAPSAGADWSAAVPSGAAWELLAVTATLTTSAVVANRIMAIQRAISGASIGNAPGPAVQPASIARGYAWQSEYGASLALGGSAGSAAPLPDSPVPSGATVASVTVNLDVGDQWSAITLYVREWSLDAVERNVEWLCEGLR